MSEEVPLIHYQLSPTHHIPRNFEYNPKIPGLLVYGTEAGQLVSVNTCTRSIIAEQQCFAPYDTIIALAWMNTEANKAKMLACTYSGALNSADLTPQEGGTFTPRVTHTFSVLESATSCNVNCTDQYCIVSGDEPDVSLFDLHDGRRANVFRNLHEGHINVTKFANHLPYLFATASYDRHIKMWDMRDVKDPTFTHQSARGFSTVCFSPDDKYILAAAIDNDVRQYLVSDGR
jgi:WD40 repeat protein